MNDTEIICAKCSKHMAGPVASGRLRWGDCGCTISSKRPNPLVRETLRLLGFWFIQLILYCVVISCAVIVWEAL